MKIYNVCTKLSSLLSNDFIGRLKNMGVMNTKQTVSQNMFVTVPLLRKELDTEIETATKALSNLLAAKELVR